MNNKEILELLKNFKNEKISIEDAVFSIKSSSYDDLGYAKIDYSRKLRQGVSEVIYGEGKTAEQIDGILSNMLKHNVENIIITRLSSKSASYLEDKHPLSYYKMAKFGIVNLKKEKQIGSIVVASGGTSDMPISEEAALTAETLGNNVTRLYDVGVAGIHRLLSNMEALSNARVIIAIAGMEGALPSVIGGLVSCPVIAVPTSIGYGANLGGIAALLSMLNSCSTGISVVNIDNGFGAGFLASRINQMEGIK